MSRSTDSNASVRASGISSDLKVWIISLAHCINDMYAAFLPTFIPFIKQSLGLDYALSGTLSLIVGACHIVIQPVMGYLSDHIRRPYLMIIGPILCGFGAIMIPNSTSYAAALCFAAMWGIGSALYHPQANGGIGYIADPERLPVSMTIFNVLGTAGVLISPVVAVTTVKWFGYGGLWITLIPPLLLAPLIWCAMPYIRRETAHKERTNGKSRFGSLASALMLLLPIAAVAFVRDFVFQGVRIFLPMKVASLGASLEYIGTILFFITLGEVLTMIPAERLSRRIGKSRVIFLSLFLSSLLLITASATGGMVSIAFYVLGGSVVYASAPLTVVAAQALFPESKSIASVVVTGMAWGLSNAAIYPMGLAADFVGVDNAMIILAVIPMLCLFAFTSKTLREC